MEELKVFENGMVPVYETSAGEKVVYGTELHKTLGAKSNYREWVHRRFKDMDAVENEDFQAFVEKSTKHQGGRPSIEHIIKLDIAKEMAMLERNENGKQVRRYFIQVEKKYKAAQEIFKKQLVDMMRFMEKQSEFNQMILEKINNIPIQQKRDSAIDPVSTCVEDESESVKRIKELNKIVTKMAKACGWERRFAFHRLYKTLEHVLDISLDDYLEIHQVETGNINISTLEMLVEYNRLYETAVRLCTNTIDSMKC